MNKVKSLVVLFIILFSNLLLLGQKRHGKLFIIGGGDRPPALMQSLADEAALTENDYAVVLPMSSGQPDTSFYYFKNDWQPFCTRPLLNFNFTSSTKTYRPWLDSLRKAKLIFITGGDQDRFMQIVSNSEIFEAIHKAYQNGATIAGTSAGAAVMSKYMITGQQLKDTVYRATFPRLVAENIVFKPGLGLISNAIIDQHFIVRSRYNRLLSALASYPKLTGIGIDEETAIIVQGNKIRVSGSSQVIVVSKPVNFSVTKQQLIKFKDVQLSIYTNGDEFYLY